MKKPTRAQTRVLQALHAHWTELGTLFTEANQQMETTKRAPSPQWFEDYHQRAVLCDALASAAQAAAVPREWIAQVHDGDRGVAWSEIELVDPAPPDWDRVLGDLTTQAQQLCEWTALDSARRQLGAVPAQAVEAFDRNLAALRARLTGVVNLLDLNATDGNGLWGSTSDWVEAGYQLLAHHPAEVVLQRWKAVARSDAEPLALQAKALAQARIKTHTSVALPDHESLTARLGVLALAQPMLFHHPAAAAGTDIGAAVEAAALDPSAADPDTSSSRSVFSHAEQVQPVAYEADLAVAAPEFVAPASELDL
ncbi:hypothetical protein [Nocardia sp. XZ_19_385]|uniref:hypothetical protein n=1 Tax=Nocardia sp. XZ_19_385 TaxID=2769488 RepID=UPI00188E0C11|nr:hypothetical protein [Nocardia sp. XZ_19_385]